MGIKQKCNVILPGNKPLKIYQTLDSLGLTKDYILFAETSFKFSLTKVLAHQQDLLLKAVKIILFDCANYPQYPIYKLCIVKRVDLEQSVVKLNRLASWFSRDPCQDLMQVIAKEVGISRIRRLFDEEIYPYF